MNLNAFEHLQQPAVQRDNLLVYLVIIPMVLSKLWLTILIVIVVQ